MKKSKCRRKAVAAVRPPHGLPLLSNQQTCGFLFFLACSFFWLQSEEGWWGLGGQGGVIISVFDFVPRVCHAGRDKER